MYASASDSNLREQGKDTFEAARMIDSVLKQPYAPAGGVQYVGDFVGRKLRQLAQLLNELGSSLAAFSHDMGTRMADIVLVTMSELGRTAAENGNNGTDHGHGGVMLVLGGPVSGGKPEAAFPGFSFGAPMGLVGA